MRRTAKSAHPRLGSATDSPYCYRGASIALHGIIVLPQPRRTFEHIVELADDIAMKRLLNLPNVARFDRTSLTHYLDVINVLWGTTYSTEAYSPTTEPDGLWYYVLLAGERRYRACKLLWETGCSACREASLPVADGACYQKHFGSPLIEVRLCEHIPPLHALYLQLSENTHMPVPEHEEAQVYANLFNLLQASGEHVTNAGFARRVGRSPSTIRHALQFCGLPVRVQDGVRKGYIRYGIAVEIARLQADGVDDEDLIWWMQRAAAHAHRVPEFRELVNAYLASRHSGQQELFEIMDAEAEKLRRRQHIRHVVERNSLNAVWTWIRYVQQVVRLLDAGLLATDGAVYSDGSPRRIVGELATLLASIHDHERHLLPPSEAQKIALLLEPLPRLSDDAATSPVQG